MSGSSPQLSENHDGWHCTVAWNDCLQIALPVTVVSVRSADLIGGFGQYWVVLIDARNSPAGPLVCG